MSVLNINFKAAMSNEFKKETKRKRQKSGRFQKSPQSIKKKITFWN